MVNIPEFLKASLGLERLTVGGVASAFREKFVADSLFKNSVYLMGSTGVQAALGFVFWILAARFYSGDDIGIATALISATMLITNFSLLGFNSTLIRFLPSAKQPNRVINTSMIIVAVASLMVATIYVVGLERFSPKLAFVQDQWIFAALFVLFTAVESVNTLTDSVFIAYRASLYNLIVYTLFSVAKVVGVVGLVMLGSLGVFFSYVGAVAVAFCLSVFFMHRKFAYRFEPTIDRPLVRRVRKFSLANYVSTFATALPVQAFPIMIVNYLGATPAAYFYIASMIANMIYVVPTATSQSMFAESSHAEAELARHTKSALKVTGVICVPIILGVLALGKLILRIFGHGYAGGAYSLLLVFALTTPLTAFFFIGCSVLKVRHEMRNLLIVSVLFPIVAVGSAWYLRRYGVLGFGYALSLAYLVTAVYLAVCIRKLFGDERKLALATAGKTATP